ncbi:hypothetical protein GC102_18370 [Paenibacillus sp. LMG 31460]|uniref:Uncharacterized protein n=1 Tax=Paenibacillus germinis TaxID=2654979 RepID=A0ABX1Z3C2_9BACL|nr:hypothetical protein [Paenibacillus germinis]NOU87723.1 hypothetical protein [Paenibacillus germinis]
MFFIVTVEEEREICSVTMKNMLKVAGFAPPDADAVEAMFFIVTVEGVREISSVTMKNMLKVVGTAPSGAECC